VIPGAATGITVLGDVSGILVGGDVAGEENGIANHQIGIQVGTSAAGPVAVEVLGNMIGGEPGAGMRGDAIRIGACQDCSIVGNVIPGAGGHGLVVEGDGVHVDENTIGYLPTPAGPLSAGIDGCGIRVRGDGNTLGPAIAGEPGAVRGNGIGYADTGICVDGHGNRIEAAAIGITHDGVRVPNRDAGIRISANVSGSLVRASAIAHNLGSGIVVEGGGSAAGNVFSGNRIVANEGPAIDLGDDGLDSNDAGDPDEGGPHRRINHPVISAAQWYVTGDGAYVRVAVTHDAPADRVDYPLFIGLHFNVGTGRDAQQPLATGLLSGPGEVLIIDARLPAGTLGGYLTGLASGVETGSSELSPSIPFGILSLFRDGFELSP
jgi:hypothetical protein